ncbi:MAG: AhpC/TSA family protein [Bacteroidetes bacterium]|nr:AhpC/TSA family protein [Bacteroidota bacterium]
MKNFFLFCAAAIFLIQSCGSNNSQKTKAIVQDSSYTITGKIAGLDSGWVYLGHPQRDGELFDSTEINSGFFTFKGKANSPELCFFALPNKDGYKLRRFDFFLENGQFNISGTKDSIGEAIVKGAATQEEYQNFDKGKEALDEEHRKLNALYSTVSAKNDPIALDSVEQAFDRLEKKQKDYVKEYARLHPSSYVSAYEVYQSFSYNPDPKELALIYNNMSTTIQNSYYGEKIKTTLEIAQKTDIGMPAIEFTMNNTNGQAVSLSSFKGKYFLLDFWASWCGPCRRENPNVVKAYRQYHNKGFDILGVSLDDSKDDWLKAIKKDGLSWTQVSDLKGWKNEAATLYGIQGIPMNFLIDKEGKIIAKNLRGQDLEKRLAEVLNK